MGRSSKHAKAKPNEFRHEHAPPSVTASAPGKADERVGRGAAPPAGPGRREAAKTDAHREAPKIPESREASATMEREAPASTEHEAPASTEREAPVSTEREAPATTEHEAPATAEREALAAGGNHPKVPTPRAHEALAPTHLPSAASHSWDPDMSATTYMRLLHEPLKPLAPYGYTGMAWEHQLDVPRATVYVRRITEQIKAHGVDAPLLLSSMALDLSAADVHKLIGALTETLVAPGAAAEERLDEEMRFASVYSLAALLKWVLGRVGRVVAQRPRDSALLVMVQERGFVPWATYAAWRERERADGYATLAYLVLTLSLIHI